MNRIHVISIVIVFLFLANCERKKNEHPFVSITPSALEIDGEPGKYISFEIDVNPDYKLQQFIID